MADIVAGDVTYTVVDETIDDGPGYRSNIVDITFGDGVDTYPSGGVPLTKAKLGMPAVIKSFSLSDPASANGFIYKYDDANEKIRIYQGDNDNVADAPLIELVGGAAQPAAATVTAHVRGY